MRELPRRSVVASLAAASVALAVACAPFGTSDGDTELAVDASSGPSTDGAPDAPPPAIVDGASDAPVFDGGPVGPGTCLDFTSAAHGVTATNANRNADGYTLEIHNGVTSSIRKSFTVSANITKVAKSVVTVAASANATGDWSNGAYVDVMAQYLGDATSYTSAPAMELEALKSRLELNVWNEQNAYDRAYPIALASLPPHASIFRLSTEWAAGKTTLDVGDASFSISTKKSSTSTTRFTVVLGGKTYGGGAPSLTINVKMLCVDLQ